jgi:hypothetical protein
MIEYEDKKQLQAEFDERYVLQTCCNDNTAHLNKMFANDDKRIDIMAHDFEIIKKLMWVIATASIGSLVAVFFELIFK